MFYVKSTPHSCGRAVFMAVAASFVMTAALWFASCTPEIEGLVVPPTVPPRLASLELDDAAFILSPDFDPEVFSYSVMIEGAPVMADGELAAVEIIAAANDASYLVEMPLGTAVTPVAGNMALVTVADSFGRKESYYIQFLQEAEELPAAKLYGVMLSVGSITAFSQNTTVYHNIPIPYGAPSVTVFPTGAQEGSYFNYTPYATVTLNASGYGTVKIGVIASGYASNEYTFNFKREDGAASELGGIALSTGALANPFDIDPEDEDIQTILVPYGTTGLTVLAVKNNWNDTVYFDSDDPSDGKHFTGPLNNTTFSITVNCGLEYVDRTYQFTIQTAAEGSPAALTALLFGEDAGIDTTVYQRNTETGENLVAGFNPAVNLYNLNFQHGAASATIMATAETGASIEVTGVGGVPDGNSVTIPVDALASSRTPVKLRVSASGRAINEYTIFFRKNNPPYASLSGLTITGIKGPQPNIAGEQPAGTHTFNDIAVYSNTQFVLVNAECPDNSHHVRYENSAGEAHNYLFAPNINNGYIKVYVSGGGDYQESVYTFNFTVLAPLVPRLSSLRVQGVDTITSPAHDILTYTANVAYSSSTTPISFNWTVDADVVSKVEYSLDYGVTPWTLNNAYSGELFSLGPPQSKVVLIKVTTHDGAQALYNITVTKAGDSTNQLISLGVMPSGGGGQLLDTFDSATYVYSLIVENSISAVDIGVAWPTLARLYKSIDGEGYTEVMGGGPEMFSDIGLTAGTPKVINFQVQPQQQDSFAATYTLTITRNGSTSNAVITSIISPNPSVVLKQQPSQVAGFVSTVYQYTAPLALTNSAALNISWPAGCVVTYTLDGNLQTLGESGSGAITVNNIGMNNPPKPLTLVAQSSTGAHSYTILFTNSNVLEVEANGSESGGSQSTQTFVAPEAGQYKIECWGAQGSSTPEGGGSGGQGGYSSGTITLAQGDTLYVYVGTQGGAPPPNDYYVNGGSAGWNGGGGGGHGDRYGNYYYGGGGGGGASDVRTSSGQWYENRSSRIIVAGGGGGAGGNRDGGAGGGGNIQPDCNGLTGQVYVGLSNGATQTNGYNDNHGQNGRNGYYTYTDGANGGGGGGGGYRNGFANTNTGINTNSGGGGGSGWVKPAAGPTSDGCEDALFLSASFTEIFGSRDVQSGDGKVKITYLGPVQ